MILVDSNVPMYLVGAEHAHKQDAQRLLDTAVSGEERLVTDTEVFQEILHRYTAIERRDAIQPAFDVLDAVVDEVLGIGRDDVEEGKRIVMGGYGLSARDAIHLAIMKRAGIDRIMSFDTDYDRFPGIQRLS